MNTTVSNPYGLQGQQMHVNNRVQQSPIVYAPPQGVWSDNNQLSTIVIFTENDKGFYTTTPVSFTNLNLQNNRNRLNRYNRY